MSKFPLDRHKENLYNSMKYEDDLITQKHYLDEKINQVRLHNKFAKLQIDEAERLGLSEYDSEKFCKKRKGVKNV